MITHGRATRRASVASPRTGRRRLRAISQEARESQPTTIGPAKAADTIGGAPIRALSALAWRRPRLAAALLVVLVAMGAEAVAGPVAALISAGYVATGAVVVAARRRAAADAKAFAAALAAIGAVAADLRAGGDPLVSLARVQPALQPAAASRLSRRLSAALRVADDTGAPLAELLDRLETDGRTLARARASATAQASGAQATAWLLAALPAAGIALGAGVGADPMHVLLRTPLGAACAGGAMTFQVVGLAWTQRLANSIKDAA
jgi:tight adherence protein B